MHALEKAMATHSRDGGAWWAAAYGVAQSWTQLKRPSKHACKGKGEKERYTHLNAEFQGIARRDKKAFLSEQCKEIKENNIMGKD